MQCSGRSHRKASLTLIPWDQGSFQGGGDISTSKDKKISCRVESIVSSRPPEGPKRDEGAWTFKKAQSTAGRSCQSACWVARAPGALSGECGCRER